MPHSDPEKRREYERRRREKIRNDPELLEKKRRQQRDGQRQRMKDPAKKAAQLARTREWNEKNRRRKRELAFKHKYGIELVEYERRHAEQEGLCAICRRPETITDPRLEGIGRGTRRLAVDHDHATGEVRGLLCYNCNTALGLFRDDPEALRAAIAYLEITCRAAD